MFHLYCNKIYKFPSIFVIFRFLGFPYFDDDALTHHSSHILGTPDFVYLHIVGVTIATSEHAFGYLDGMLLTRNLMLLFVGAFLAFMLELSEFLVVSHSSGLTLAIAGIFKVRRIHLHQ